MSNFKLFSTGIDKLSVTMGLTDDQLDHFGCELNEVAAFYGVSLRPGSRYSLVLKIKELGLHVGFGPYEENNRASRFEFNPNNNPEKFPEIKDILKSLYGEAYGTIYDEGLCTRIDLNTDFITDKHNYIFLDSKRLRVSKKFTYIATEFKAGQVGTIIVGSNKSSRRAKIYDKTAEFFAKHEQIYCDLPADQRVIRFEEVLKPGKKGFAHLFDHIDDIFDNVTIYSLPIEERFFPFFLAHCSLYGLKASLDLLHDLSPAEEFCMREFIADYECRPNINLIRRRLREDLNNFIDVADLLP